MTKGDNFLNNRIEEISFRDSVIGYNKESLDNNNSNSNEISEEFTLKSMERDRTSKSSAALQLHDCTETY